jgi:hypothetical protein
MPSETEALLRFMAVRRISPGVLFVPCRGCGVVVDAAAAPVDAHLCALCAVAAAGLRRS